MPELVHEVSVDPRESSSPVAPMAPLRRELLLTHPVDEASVKPPERHLSPARRLLRRYHFDLQAVGILEEHRPLGGRTDAVGSTLLVEQSDASLAQLVR